MLCVTYYEFYLIGLDISASSHSGSTSTIICRTESFRLYQSTWVNWKRWLRVRKVDWMTRTNSHSSKVLFEKSINVTLHQQKGWDIYFYLAEVCSNVTEQLTKTINTVFKYDLEYEFLFISSFHQYFINTLFRLQRITHFHKKDELWIWDTFD